MDVKLQMYKTDQGTKTVLVGPRGRKLLPILLIEASGLTVAKVPMIEEKFLSDPPPFKRHKSQKALAKQYRAIGKRLGMTKAAKSFLSKVINAG